jgi:hypothetical protein
MAVKPPLMICRALALLAVAFLAGCGPNMVTVTGNVTYRGKPVESGTVMFQPESGPVARGAIQPDGSFRLKTDNLGDKMPVGNYKVRIASYLAGTSLGPEEREATTGTLAIPRRYAHFGLSGLEREVTADKHHFQFDLED